MGFALVAVAVLAVLVLMRLWLVWPRLGVRSKPQRKGSKVRTLLVLGSGGHTSELLPVVRALPADVYTPRLYVAADERSIERANALEQGRKGFATVTIPRARHVGQSYATSVLTTLWASVFSLWTVLRFRPQVVLCNGPGICVPIAAAALVLRFVLGREACRVIFIESGCRLERLSLSGLIMYHLRLCDGFLVQWEALRERYPRASCVGRTL